jgi:hypothetical protein
VAFYEEIHPDRRIPKAISDFKTRVRINNTNNTKEALRIK